jgi:general stress protein 26
LNYVALKDQIMEVIKGQNVAAVATIKEENSQFLPAVRYMLISGMDDLTLMAATTSSSRKVNQISKNENVSLTVWGGRDLGDPYVVISAKAEIHEDIVTKRGFWLPGFDTIWKGPEDPEFTVIRFIPYLIEYCHGWKVDVWKPNEASNIS